MRHLLRGMMTPSMQSKAATVEDYLAELPADRRAEIEQVRRVILKNLDKSYEEGMQYGMIGYYVPHRIYPAGYHSDPRQPLPFVCLASQKNHLSLYMMPVYGDDAWFQKEWAKTGKKLDMGKSCIRFKRAEDLALDVIGKAIRQMPVKRWIEFYESTVKATRTRKGASTRPAKSAATRKAKGTGKAKKATARKK